MFCDQINVKIEIKRPFIKLVREKFNKINVAQYIIERLVYDDIMIAHSHKIANRDRDDNYLFTVAAQHKTFEIMYNNKEDMAGFDALTYVKKLKRPGVIFSASKSSFLNIAAPLYNGFIYGHPLLLVSLYKSEWPMRIMPIHRFIKDACTVSESSKFPYLFEYMMILSKLPKPGPVHLHILNNILMEPVVFADDDK